MTRESLASREPGMWKWRELLPFDCEPVSLGEPETPIVPLPKIAALEAASDLLVKDEGRLPTGSFKARGLAWRSPWQSSSESTKWRCRPTATPVPRLLLTRARAGIEAIVICPSETPEINVTETAAVWSARLRRRRPDRRMRQASVGKGAAEAAGSTVSTLKEPYRIEGKKTMGFELAEQLGLGAARRRSSIRPAAARA